VADDPSMKEHHRTDLNESSRAAPRRVAGYG
jgi:hypothetical protein